MLLNTEGFITDTVNKCLLLLLLINAITHKEPAKSFVLQFLFYWL